MPSQFLTPMSVDNHNRSVGKYEPGAMLSMSRTTVLIFVFVGVACGGAPAPRSNLPRTTNQNISITMIESVETLAMAGCHTYWLTLNQEPPPGACEQTATVRRFIAQHDSEDGGNPAKGPTTVETSVVGELTFDPLYAMQLASRNLTEGASVVVVMPPPDTTLVRLIDSTGAVVDRVTASSGLVSLAGLGSDLTVQAISADGNPRRNHLRMLHCIRRHDSDHHHDPRRRPDTLTRSSDGGLPMPSSASVNIRDRKC